MSRPPVRPGPASPVRRTRAAVVRCAVPVSEGVKSR
ncbi:hypothetical protein SFR_5820 [Streptomyces sp. FR-008]|nr:hypothetical protein SFR_5820 [Streptomyces sp. FR-008]